MATAFTQSFFDSLIKRTAEEQIAVNQAVATFMRDPTNGNLQRHQCRDARSPGMCSIRAGRILRVILHKNEQGWVFLYADRHDAAYDWAKNKEIAFNGDVAKVIEVEEKVEVREKVIETRRYQDAPLFEDHTDEYLLSLGVPEEWLLALRKVRSVDHLLTISVELPDEVGARLLTIGEGKIEIPKRDIQRITSDKELAYVIRGWRLGGRSIEEIAEAMGTTAAVVLNKELLLEFPDTADHEPAELYEAVGELLDHLTGYTGEVDYPWSKFESWCSGYGMRPKPASQEVVCLFLVDLFRAYDSRIVRTALSLISRKHDEDGLVRPSEYLPVRHLLEVIKQRCPEEKATECREVPPPLGGQTRKFSEEDLKPLVDEGLTQREICSRLGVGRDVVRRELKRYGLKTRFSQKREIPIETLKPLVDEGLTQREICSRLKIDRGVVRRELKRHDLKLRSTAAQGRREIPFETLKPLVDEGLTQREICSRLDVGRDVIRREMKRHDLELTSPSKKEIPIETLKPLVDRGLNQREIRGTLRVGKEVVRRELLRHGLQISYSQKKVIPIETLKPLVDKGLNQREIGEVLNVSDDVGQQVTRGRSSRSRL
jgi:transposase